MQYPRFFSMIFALLACACQSPGFVPVNERTNPSAPPVTIVDRAAVSGVSSQQSNSNNGINQSSGTLTRSAVNLNDRRYRVQTGDTLFSIALMYQRDYRQLATINRIKKPYVIYPGQVLVLKKSVKPVSNAANRKPATEKNTTVKRKPKVATTASRKVPPTRKPTPVKATNNRVKSNIRWQWPTNGRIVRRFGQQKFKNQGIDIGGQLGQPVLAAAQGEVVYAGNGLRGYGNLVIVKHNEVFLSAYAYNSEILVKEGAIIKKGQPLARMGKDNSGKELLHFEIRRRGKPVDPLSFLPKLP